jgi:hypothetical protein
VKEAFLADALDASWVTVALVVEHVHRETARAARTP